VLARPRPRPRLTCSRPRQRLHMKQNARSLRKHLLYVIKCPTNYPRSMMSLFLQKSSLLHFANTIFTQYTLTHTCPVGTHEDASMAEDPLQWAEVVGTQYMELTNLRRGLNWSLPRTVLTVVLTMKMPSCQLKVQVQCTMQRCRMHNL